MVDRSETELKSIALHLEQMDRSGLLEQARLGREIIEALREDLQKARHVRIESDGGPTLSYNQGEEVKRMIRKFIKEDVTFEADVEYSCIDVTAVVKGSLSKEREAAS